MAAPLGPGLTPAEVAFLCESELVTVVPRQRLESINLLSGPTPELRPPHPANLPLWLALLLKRQGRANIAPPPWLSVAALTAILADETSSPSFSAAPPLPTQPAHSKAPLRSPPFLPTSTTTSATAAANADANANARHLPYHFLTLSTLLLQAAADDIPDAEAVRRLLRDVREARAAKLRQGVEVLEGGRAARLDGVGALEVAEHGAFIQGVVDGLRVVGASKEGARREREREERETGGAGRGGEESDEDML